MDTTDLITLIKTAIAENGDTLRDDIEITSSTLISELGISSISFIELVFSIEEALGITIEMDPSTPIHTVGDFIHRIEEELSKKNG